MSTRQDKRIVKSQVKSTCDRTAAPNEISRRDFVQMLGAGLLIAVSAPVVSAQRGGRGGGGGRARSISARLHVGIDGTISVMTGKIEQGQGARAEITAAAAEELGVAASRLNLIMGDTSLVPDDGPTVGSMTTPLTIPPVRQAAAAARTLLIGLAAQKWGVDRAALQVSDGKITHAASNRTLTYADLARTEDLPKAFAQAAPADVTVRVVKDWKVLGTPLPRPNGRDLVTGAHRFPSDIIRPGMLYGKVLRAPAYGVKLISVDLAPAKAMKDVVVVQEGSFVGVAARTTLVAERAIEEIAKTAQWETSPQPSSTEIFGYLKRRAQNQPANPFADELAKAAKVLKATYNVAYIQHTPMETRSAVAEWADGKLTVWTGTQNPFGWHSQLVQAFGLATDAVRLLVPDFGGGFGGKSQGEVHVEAARLAKAAGKPVCVKWTRAEEFTWAYFRPAAVIEIEAGLDPKGVLTSWHFVNINAGSPGIETPYRAGRAQSRSVNTNSPLRQGSYRALASTGNNFARECFMDELAAAAGADPLEFRLAHLDNPRIRAVLEAATQRFDWKNRVERKSPTVGVGLACGTEKNSVVAACAEIALDEAGKMTVCRVCEAFECGKILNPVNLMSQVQGCIIMGMGAALREEMRFANGKILNASFGSYEVPRFDDVPELDIQLLDRPDMNAVGGGETPIIAIAPAIANAVYHATGKRVRALPIKVPV
ncbi:MAG: molybdopterin-dependent oxidoreductase [Planctomycetota bacterium]|nr:molybdopterin-dependent oxidoreductase [Planctomycetota bacterium]